MRWTSSHEQGDLRADERADDEGEGDHRDCVDVGEGEGEVEQDDREAADDAQRGLDEGEGDCGELGQALRGQGPDAHREYHDRKDDRGLNDGVAEEVGAECDERELVDHAAAGADEDGQEHEEAGGSWLQRQRDRFAAADAIGVSGFCR